MHLDILERGNVCLELVDKKILFSFPTEIGSIASLLMIN
jgi:hypothetical protein